MPFVPWMRHGVGCTGLFLFEDDDIGVNDVSPEN